MKVIPQAPMTVEEVVELFPTLRQSLLSKYDDCGLSSLMEHRYSVGWSTHPQAAGIVFHLFAAMFMRELQSAQSATMPVQLSEQLMVAACRQEDVPARDIVRVPLRKMPELRMAARKFASDNRFSHGLIVDVERRLEATLTYPHPDGGLVERRLTGRIDALLEDKDHPDGAVVVDWKYTFGLPPEPKEKDPEARRFDDDETAGLSYHGFFQQRTYAWLVMKCYPKVMQVTLREFYPLKTAARKATVYRHQLEDIEEELSVLAQAFDAAVMQGSPPFPFGYWPVTDPETGEVLVEDGRPVREFSIERLGRWKPQPGRHCGFCARARDCPLDEDTRIEQGAPPATPERARGIAGEIQVIEKVRERLLASAKAYVELGGEPIPVKDAKGRRMLGWYKTKRGRRFGFFTPNESDRGGHADIASRDLDAELAGAMREASARARRERPARGGKA